MAELEAKRQDFGAGAAALDKEIERLERRQVDAEVVRRNLGHFVKVFAKLTERERAEVIGLLVKRVVYDGEKSRVQVALRPLSEAWGDLDHLEGSFADRQTWLPVSYAHQSQARIKNPLILWHEVRFEVILDSCNRTESH